MSKRVDQNARITAEKSRTISLLAICVVSFFLSSALHIVASIVSLCGASFQFNSQANQLISLKL